MFKGMKWYEDKKIQNFGKLLVIGIIIFLITWYFEEWIDVNVAPYFKW